MPLVSVIIPTHNRSGLCIKAVTSVLTQTWKDVEVLLVDDGSDDDTLMRAARIADPRLRVFSQENKGVSAARNLGAAHACGRYIALLDSDDYWLPTKLERQLRFMREGGFHISQTEEIWIRRGKRVNPKHIHTKVAGWMFAPSLALCLISPSCVMLTRALWDEVGPFDEALPACEDYDLWLKTCLRVPVGLVPEALVVKTGGRADQLSGKIIGLDLYRIYAMRNVLDQGVLNDEDKDELVRMLRMKAMIYIKGCLKRGRFAEAQRLRQLLGPRLAAG
ncbi:glycosyltransferase family 2 protein [Desulfoplanes formicivorans]|uniref:Glycosyl transferase n=1 Tax=Desulfoplanes formicivorans TaxID=1592317 RepID=A0A194AB87_9BACT|nr:glycosyltransferase family A protein [Desulfoplanes formicivorans]GAU07437.1 glycosyl transferase [Desulfoplanes formicivorans]